MQYKSLPVEYKVDEDKREIEAYISTFGNVDSGNDRIQKGAFTKTLQEDKMRKNPRIKALWQHRFDSPVGKPVYIEEDSKGVLTVTKISPTTLGNDLLILAKDGVISETSIGFSAVQQKWAKDGVRDITELKLFEYSYVTLAMNEQATITGMKSLDQLWNYLDVIYEMQKEVKAGRVLSEKNTLLVKQAHDALGALLGAAEPLQDTLNSKEAAINITAKSSDHLPDDAAYQAILNEMKKYVGSV
jgi:HK97 family phage prohead protease